MMTMPRVAWMTVGAALLFLTLLQSQVDASKRVPSFELPAEEHLASSQSSHFDLNRRQSGSWQ